MKIWCENVGLCDFLRPGYIRNLSSQEYVIELFSPIKVQVFLSRTIPNILRISLKPFRRNVFLPAYPYRCNSWIIKDRIIGKMKNCINRKIVKWGSGEKIGMKKCGNKKMVKMEKWMNEEIEIWQNMGMQKWTKTEKRNHWKWKSANFEEWHI